MADLTDFEPLLSEDVESIRGRLDADVNAGLAPEDEAFIDTVVGGFYYDLSQAILLEIERLWDFLSTEVPAAAFVTTAWDIYLDEHGDVIGAERKPANQATGTVTFSGDNGTIIPQGFRVARPQTDVDEETIEFETLADALIATGTADVAIRATDVGSVGNVAAGTITVLLTPQTGVNAVVNANATSGGADVEEDEAYRARLLIEYSARQGPGAVADFEKWALEYPGVGFVTVTPLWAGAGTVHVVVTDLANSPVSTTVRDGLQSNLDLASADTLLDGGQVLPSATITVDSTVGFTDVGYIYINDQRVKYTGVTGTTFTGCTGGTGSQLDNSPVVQRGHGLGRAPIGLEATVTTPTTLTVDVDATVDLKDGYTLDGAAGTTEVGSKIEDAITRYINALHPSEDVLLSQIEARILGIEGVYNVGTISTPVTLNGSGTDLLVSDSQVVSTGTVALIEL